MVWGSRPLAMTGATPLSSAHKAAFTFESIPPVPTAEAPPNSIDEPLDCGLKVCKSLDPACPGGPVYKPKRWQRIATFNQSTERELRKPTTVNVGHEYYEVCINFDSKTRGNDVIIFEYVFILEDNIIV